MQCNKKMGMKIMSDKKVLVNTILVKDNSVDSIMDSEVYVFLKEHGFTRADGFHPLGVEQFPPCNWIYVSLSEKLYVQGLPGIAVTSVLGNHAITVDEFLSIYNLFEKYKGLSILDMSKAEFDLREMKWKEAQERREDFFGKTSFDDYLALCKKEVYNIVGEKEPEKYVDAFMKYEAKWFEDMFGYKKYPESLAYAINMMYERYETAGNE